MLNEGTVSLPETSARGYGGVAGSGHVAGDGTYPTWGALRWLFFFRLLLVVGLTLVLSPNNVDNPFVTRANANMAWDVLVVYAILVLVSGLGLYTRWPSRENQVALAVFVDIFIFTLLMHAGGGVTSGLGVLIAVAVAAGAMMMEGRLSLLFASIGTLAVITQQVYMQLQGDLPTMGLTHAGLLGSMFFAVALLSHILYRRVRDAESLAARRKVDIDDLSKLNEFVLQNMSTGVVVVDGERRMRLMNQAAKDLLEAPAARPGEALSEISPEVAQWLNEHVQPAAVQGGSVRIDDREIKPSRQLLGDYRAAGVLIYLRDNQELVKEAQQFKLAALGTLTASIAHNIRNPLSSISHAGQLLAESDSLHEDDQHLLGIIRRNSLRIDEIVQSVLQLSRRNQVAPQAVDLTTWLEDFCTDFREAHGLAEDRLVLEHAPAPMVEELDPRHLHQIVANLCENALVHAGSPDAPPTIRIRLARSEPHDRTLIEIIDDGPGIDDETAREIFSPFFTTKSTGTGLGLYISRELAETNGIRLQYSRTQPTGSCFRLTFVG